MTLLEKANASPVRNSVKKATPELEELSLAWLKREISTGQASRALGVKPSYSSAYSHILMGLRSLWMRGVIQEVKHGQ